jgi:osmotically-inducible protein OsmY
MTFWVRQAVLHDPRIGPADITVDTSDGIVTLVGSVPNVSARQYADREAKKIAGVRGVVNELFVAPSFRVDTDIAQDVRQRLNTSAPISSDALRVTVHQGSVTLEGTVASWAERQEAGLLAGEVRGVRAVTKTQAVADQIRVTVNQAVVTLTGTVNFWSERATAGEVAFKTMGVRRIDNQLVVMSTEAAQ